MADNKIASNLNTGNTAAFTAAFCPKPTSPTNPLSRRRFLTGLIGLVPIAAVSPVFSGNGSNQYGSKGEIISPLLFTDESPEEPTLPPTALALYHTFIDLHRAGDFDAAAMALGDCVYALPKFHRNYVINLVGVLTESEGAK